jgi:hypothetical protein
MQEVIQPIKINVAQCKNSNPTNQDQSYMMQEN